jgi:hypothetical protein
MFAMTGGACCCFSIAAIGALFAYLLVHDFWTGQSQRAVLVATIYFGSFTVIGAQLRIFSEFGGWSRDLPLVCCGSSAIF